MRVLYLAVMHERDQREYITAKYSTSMISSVSYHPGFLFISRLSHYKFPYSLERDTESRIRIPYHALRYSEIPPQCGIKKTKQSVCYKASRDLHSETVVILHQLPGSVPQNRAQDPCPKHTQLVVKETPGLDQFWVSILKLYFSVASDLLLCASFMIICGAFSSFIITTTKTHGQWLHLVWSLREIAENLRSPQYFER